MPYFTEEQRKEPIVRRVEYFTFHCLADLSTGVRVVCEWKTYRHFLDKRPDIVASEIARFTSFWMSFFHGNLNVFSGMDTVKWTFEDNIPEYMKEGHVDGEE